MRENKFRGMDIQGRWFYGNLAVLKRDVAQGHKKGHYISNSVGMPFAYHVRPETVGQYTNLNDKNGKEIYEGDIVNHRRIGNHPLTCGAVTIHPTQGVKVADWPICFDCEVIGNIYEHADLLP